MARWAWRLVDPLLLTLRRRMAHLERHHPEPEVQVVGAEFDGTARLVGHGRIINGYDPSQIRVGPYARICGELQVVTPEASLHVGKNVYVGEGTKIWAQQEVVIGNHVLIAHGVDIFDTNAHSLVASERRLDGIALFERGHQVDWSKIRSAPIRIEDDAWIGLKSIVTKGITIGRGAVVAAGSVVTRDVPPFTLVAGSPAREVRRLPEEA